MFSHLKIIIIKEKEKKHTYFKETCLDCGIKILSSLFFTGDFMFYFGNMRDMLTFNIGSMF